MTGKNKNTNNSSMPQAIEVAPGQAHNLEVDMASTNDYDSESDPTKLKNKWHWELGFLFLCLCVAAVVGGSMAFERRSSTAYSTDQGPTGEATATDPNPTGSQVKDFDSRDELLLAVDSYLGDERQEVVNVYGDIRNWRVGKLTDFTAIFRDRANFNEPLDWDVSQATTLREMFSGSTYFDHDLQGWDVSNVKDMSFLFYDATNFDGDISTWDVSSVRDMSFMLTRAQAFDQDLSGWDVSSVTNMKAMLNGASSFHQDLCGWGTVLPSQVSTDYAFSESGCQIKKTPDTTASPPGPFCSICV